MKTISSNKKTSKATNDYIFHEIYKKYKCEYSFNHKNLLYCGNNGLKWQVTICNDIISTSILCDHEIQSHDNCIYVLNGKLWQNVHKDHLKHILQKISPISGIEPCVGQSKEFLDKLFDQFVCSSNRFVSPKPLNSGYELKGGITEW
jgi:hypothetical protein